MLNVCISLNTDGMSWGEILVVWWKFVHVHILDKNVMIWVKTMFALRVGEILVVCWMLNQLLDELTFIQLVICWTDFCSIPIWWNLLLDELTSVQLTFCWIGFDQFSLLSFSCLVDMEPGLYWPQELRIGQCWQTYHMESNLLYVVVAYLDKQNVIISTIHS